MNEAQVAIIAEQVLDRFQTRYVRRLSWALWGTVALIVTGILVTDWRLFALAGVAAVVGAYHAMMLSLLDEPKAKQRINAQVRFKLAKNPNWRPKS